MVVIHYIHYLSRCFFLPAAADVVAMGSRSVAKMEVGMWLLLLCGRQIAPLACN